MKKFYIRINGELMEVDYKVYRVNITVRQSRQSGVARATCPD
jgi:hypothetical protein